MTTLYALILSLALAAPGGGNVISQAHKADPQATESACIIVTDEAGDEIRYCGARYQPLVLAMLQAAEATPAGCEGPTLETQAGGHPIVRIHSEGGLCCVTREVCWGGTGTVCWRHTRCSSADHHLPGC